MNINNPIIKFAMYGNPEISRKIRNYGKIDLCTLFFVCVWNLLTMLVISFFGVMLILFPIGYVIGEVVGAIVTGYWVWHSAYGYAAIAVGGIVSIISAIFVVAGIALLSMEIKEYKGDNIAILFLKSIKEKTCYQVQIKK